MRLLAGWALLLVVGGGPSLAASTTATQSLAEVARKEKDRRAEAETMGTAPVIDNETLTRAQGDGLSVMGAEPAPVSPSNGADGADAEPPGEAAVADGEDAPSDLDTERAGLSAAEIRDYRETWARIWPERLAAAEKELELAKEAVYQCQSGAHYVFVPLAVDCNGVYERRAIAEYHLKEIQQNRFNWELLLPETRRSPLQP